MSEAVVLNELDAPEAEAKAEEGTGKPEGVIFPEVSIEHMLAAGVHFGHQDHRWNPKMSRYIFAERNGIHIMDLTQTVRLMDRALKAIRDTVRKAGRILFVGTKMQAAPIVAEAAKRCAQYYINHRWLGGTLTNWKTIAASIQRLRKMEELVNSDMSGYTKKEQAKFVKEYEKHVRALGGIEGMGGVPDMIIVIDVNKDFIAVEEAKKLGIRIVAILDSNSDPDGIHYPIPGNDDATRAIQYYCDMFSEAVLAGLSSSAASGDREAGAGQISADSFKKKEREKDAQKRRENGKGSRPKLTGAASGKAEREVEATQEHGPSHQKAPQNQVNEASDTQDERSLSHGGTAASAAAKAAVKQPESVASHSASSAVSGDKGDKGENKASASSDAIKILRERTSAGFVDCKKALVESGGDIEGAIDILRKKGISKAASKVGRETSQGLVTLAKNETGATMIELNCETDFVARNEKFQTLLDKILPLAFEKKGDLEAMLASQPPEGVEGETLQQGIAHLIATIGENIALRRSVFLPIEDKKVVGSYVHNQIAPNKGQIGTLVLLRSEAPKEALQTLADQLAVHVAASDVRAIHVSELDETLVARERAIAQEQSQATGKPEAVVAKMVEGRLNKFYAEVVLLKQNFVLDQDKRVEEVIKAFETTHKTPVAVERFVKFKLGEEI